jgi:putative redox protein
MARTPRKIVARWVDGRVFKCETSNGNLMLTDGDRKYAAGPMELLLVGMAGCTGIDILDILQKKRLAVSGLEVRVEGLRAEEYPMVYTDIDVVYVVRGKGISRRAVEQAIHLSEDKYCSASIMLGKTAKITSRYEIVEETA